MSGTVNASLSLTAIENEQRSGASSIPGETLINQMVFFLSFSVPFLGYASPDQQEVNGADIRSLRNALLDILFSRQHYRLKLMFYSDIGPFD